MQSFSPKFSDNQRTLNTLKNFPNFFSFLLLAFFHIKCSVKNFSIQLFIESKIQEI